MAVLTVTFTDDILKLVSRINFTAFPADRNAWENQEKLTWGIDFNSLYGGSYVFEDVSRIIGVYDKHIEGTEDDPFGVQFPKELEGTVAHLELSKTLLSILFQERHIQFLFHLSHDFIMDLSFDCCIDYIFI